MTSEYESYQKALASLKSDDMVDVVDRIERGIRNEETWAYALNGQRFFFGWQCDIDNSKASLWFVKAFENGVDNAAFAAAISFQHQGDVANWLKYLQLAYEADDIRAISYVGFGYQGRNEWPEIDLEKAAQCHMAAAARGQLVSRLEYLKFKTRGDFGVLSVLTAIFVFPWAWLHLRIMQKMNPEDLRVRVYDHLWCEQHDRWELTDI